MHTGKLLTKASEQLDAIALEQYRLRKEKAADIHALNIRLFYDLTRLKRVPATITFTDNVSNYNLLVHNIASLILQRSNIPKYPIRCTFTTLQNM